MLDSMRPDVVCRDVASIDLGALKEMDVRALVFDLDNTLTLWNDLNVPKGLKEWMDECRGQGFSLCICSNNHTPRIQPVADKLGLEFVPDAGKPAPEAFLHACKLMGVQPQNAAAVGDQLMTDVIGAKRAGLHAVLVNPLGKREFVGTYFNRIAERVLLRIMGVKRK